MAVWKLGMADGEWVLIVVWSTFSASGFASWGYSYVLGGIHRLGLTDCGVFWVGGDGFGRF